MTLTTINSEGIEDGSIKDIDVKSNAAIDGSKIDPDFGSQDIVTTGNVSTSKVLIGTTVTNTNDVLIVSDPGNVFMSIRSDAAGDNTKQFLDFGTGTADRASANLTACIAATIHSQSGGTLKSDLTFQTNSGNSISDKLIIKDTGKVGIGETDPDRFLHIKSGSNSDDGVLRIESANNNIMDTGVDGTGHFINCVSADPFRVKFAGTEKLRIKSDGDVGIGNDSPSCRLAVTDTATHTAYASSTPSISDCMLAIYNSPSSEAINNHATIQMSVNGGSHNRVNTISAVAESASNRKLALAFCTDSGNNRNERMRITGDGNVTVNDGDLVVANGHGIDFSAWSNTGGTGTGNKHETLTAYEQGTFTPRLRPNDSETGMVTGAGTYVRVGHIVHMRFSFTDVDTTSLPDGKTVTIDQLPFTCDLDGQSGYNTTTSLMMQHITAKTEGTFYTVDNVNYIFGIYANSASTWSGWQTNDFNNNASTYLNFSLSMLCD